MFFIGVALFYIAGDKLVNAYTFSLTAVWILLGLGIIEVIGKHKRV